MEARFWRIRWHEECERTRYLMDFAIVEGAIITGLAAALVWALLR